MKIGTICLFREEQPEHSPYGIHALIHQLQAVDNMEMVVVANGCQASDELRGYVDTLHNVLLLELSLNIGIPAGWNLGLDLLSGCDYYFILNDDVMVEPIIFDRLIEALKESDNRLAAVGVEGEICNALNEKGLPAEGQKIKRKKDNIFSKLRKTSSEIIEASNTGGFLCAISGVFLKETRFRFDTQFSPIFYEEFELAFFARKHGYKVAIVTGLSQYYNHSWGLSEKGGEIKYLDSVVNVEDIAARNGQLFKKKWGGRMLELLKP